MKILGLLIAVFFFINIQACKKEEGLFEKAGKKFDKAVEDIGEQVDKTKKDLEE